MAFGMGPKPAYQELQINSAIHSKILLLALDCGLMDQQQ